MSKFISDEKKEEWKNKIENQRASGLSIEQWCRENNISSHIYYYWRRKIYSQVVLSHSAFIEIADSIETGVVITYQSFQIHIKKQFDSTTLKRCLDVLKEIKC